MNMLTSILRHDNRVASAHTRVPVPVRFTIVPLVLVQ